MQATSSYDQQQTCLSAQVFFYRSSKKELNHVNLVYISILIVDNLEQTESGTLDITVKSRA